MSQDDSAIMEVKQTLGTLTTALVTRTTRVEQLSQGKASQMARSLVSPAWDQGWGQPPYHLLTSGSHISLAWGQPHCHLDMEHQVQTMVEHRLRTAQMPALALTDDEIRREEETRIVAPG